jgi:hypothetical protein
MDFEAKAAAAEEKRKKELHTELGRKDAVELDLYAKQLGIDISDAKTPEDKRAAIELQAEEQAKAAMADARIKHMESEQGRKVAREDDNRDDTAKIVRQLNALFCRDIPQDARSGSFKPGKDDALFGGEYDVADGKYRVAGSDWVFEIRKKKLAGAVQATQANQYGGKGVVSIA